MSGTFADIRTSERDLARAHSHALGLGAFTLPKEGDSLSSSEDATRHYKASESVVSAFAAEGFGSAPSGLASMVADYINMSTRNIPIQKLASMTPGSGELGRVASAGVNIAIGSLTPDQREVMKAGGNPLNPADMASIGAKLGLAGYTLLANREGGVGGNNGGRFSGMKDEAGTNGGKAGSVLEGAYSSLLKEGYKAAELKAVMPYAKELGWTDRQSLRILADTGPAGGEVAKEFENARKRGDKAGMEKARQKAEENKNNAKTDKERRGWEGLGKKFDSLNKNTVDPKVDTTSQTQRAATNPNDFADAKKMMEELRKKRAAKAEPAG